MVDLPSRYMQRMSHPEISDDMTLYAFLDFSVCPISFDVVDQVLAAVMECRNKGLKKVHIVVVPGHENGFKTEEPIFASVYDHEARRWRLQNMCIPIFSLIPMVSGYTVCDDRKSAHRLEKQVSNIMPRGYSVKTPVIANRRDIIEKFAGGQNIFPLIAAPDHALRYVDTWLEANKTGQRLICITLRQSKFAPERNSNLDAWLSFAKGLDPSLYFPVLILDTDHAMKAATDNLNGVKIFREAPWNIALRAAMYQRAWLVVGTLSGPTELCWYNEMCRYLFVAPVAGFDEERIALMQEMGFTIGENFPFAKDHQKILWHEEDTELIRIEFDQLAQDVAANTE